MIDPSIETLMLKHDSRYTLIIEVSNRARQLVDGAEPLVRCKSNNPVSIAVQEVHEGKVSYRRNNEPAV